MTREQIIEATIDLINESDGDINNVSIRKIAKKLNIAVGLINYHFESKEKLIELCVERIINIQVMSFKPSREEADSLSMIKTVATEVADYLWENKAVSRISIMSDFNNPKIDDNTMKSIKGLMYSVKDESLKLESFMLVSLMQDIFLRSNILKEFGYELENKNERDSLINKFVDVIFSKGEMK